MQLQLGAAGTMHPTNPTSEDQCDMQVKVFTLVKDMSDVSAVKCTLEELPEDFREIDILLNNAGLALGVAAGHEANIEVRLICLSPAPAPQVTVCPTSGMQKKGVQAHSDANGHHTCLLLDRIHLPDNSTEC